MASLWPSQCGVWWSARRPALPAANRANTSWPSSAGRRCLRRRRSGRVGVALRRPVQALAGPRGPGPITCAPTALTHTSFCRVARDSTPRLCYPLGAWPAGPSGGVRDEAGRGGPYRPSACSLGPGAAERWLGWRGRRGRLGSASACSASCLRSRVPRCRAQVRRAVAPEGVSGRGRRQRFDGCPRRRRGFNHRDSTLMNLVLGKKKTVVPS